MRVVAGELRGRKIEAPPGGSTRPTTDKAREAVFNALASLDVVVDARVADLFSGSGALGIEALSRGAAHCTFVERDRRALEVIEGNVATLGLRERSRVRAGDAVSIAASLGELDLVFADPPYDFVAWPRLLDVVCADLLVAEAGAAIAAEPGWERGRVKRYGRTWVTFLHRVVVERSAGP